MFSWFRISVYVVGCWLRMRSIFLLIGCFRAVKIVEYVSSSLMASGSCSVFMRLLEKVPYLEFVDGEGNKSCLLNRA